MIIVCRSRKDLGQVGKLVLVETSNADRSRADAMVIRLRELVEEISIDLISSPSHPECFKFEPVIALFGSPGASSFGNFYPIPFAKFATSAIAGAIFRKGEVGEELSD